MTMKKEQAPLLIRILYKKETVGKCSFVINHFADSVERVIFAISLLHLLFHYFVA